MQLISGLVGDVLKDVGSQAVQGLASAQPSIAAIPSQLLSEATGFLGKQLLGTPAEQTKGIGDACTSQRECGVSGFAGDPAAPLIGSAVGCLNGTCQFKRKDWAGTWWAPDECVGRFLGPRGSCGVSEAEMEYRRKKDAQKPANNINKRVQVATGLLTIDDLKKELERIAPDVYKAYKTLERPDGDWISAYQDVLARAYRPLETPNLITDIENSNNPEIISLMSEVQRLKKELAAQRLRRI